MAIAREVFDFCDRKELLEAIKRPMGFTFLSRKWRENEEVAQEAIREYPENVWYTDQ